MVTYEQAVATLDADLQEVVAQLHARALSIGYSATPKPAGKKSGSFKLEYRRKKGEDVLFISRIAGGKLSVACKLYNLRQYVELIDGLDTGLRAELLSAKPCNMESGCTAYIRFNYGGVEYFTCRHTMRLKGVGSGDVNGLWGLLLAEDGCRG